MKACSISVAASRPPNACPSPRWEKVLALYGEKYFDLNVRHFHEKLGEQHAMELSYTWVKSVLQGAGLVARQRQRMLIGGIISRAIGSTINRVAKT